AFGAISDKTGLKKDFVIETGGYDFEVETVANFEINDVQFSRDDKKITFDITSSLENNFAEVQIPINLIDGDLTFFVNGQEIFPDIRKNDKISFIVLEFEGVGHNVLEIIGTTYLPEFSGIAILVMSLAFTAVMLSRKFQKI
ncbi:MAG TPA: hypothetical protein VLB45_05635, partial [Nitrosopumilaceae archaeon]|nr:hypothetical protein [Nitrosopumilaceae archaeon]